jgi:hypothetical protein
MSDAVSVEPSSCPDFGAVTAYLVADDEYDEGQEIDHPNPCQRPCGRDYHLMDPFGGWEMRWAERSYVVDRRPPGTASASEPLPACDVHTPVMTYERIAAVMGQMNEWELRTVGHVPLPEPLEPAMLHPMVI